MSINKASSTENKHQSYMATRMSYKKGGSKYKGMSALERRKEYNEKLKERSDKYKEAHSKNAAADLMKSTLSGALSDLESKMAEFTRKAVYALYGIEEETNSNGTTSLVCHDLDDSAAEETSGTTSSFGLYVGNSKEQQYQSYIEKYAKEYNLDPNLVAAVINQESTWNPNAVSSANCQGLMQVSAKYVSGNLKDPETNIREGCKILRNCLNTYNNDTAHALVAYNEGITAAKNKPTSNYSNKVIAEYNKRTGLAQNTSGQTTGSRLNYSA